jgi:hypothetical protein
MARDRWPPEMPSALVNGAGKEVSNYGTPQTGVPLPGNVTKHANAIPAGVHAKRDAAPLCSICQTPIQAEDPSINCNQCQLPFHSECWEENLGCSAYGCSNVNTLRTGPDIRVSLSPSSGAAAVADSHTPTANDAIPWEYLLLAAATLGTLLGLLCFGVLAVLIGVVSLVYFVATGRERPSAVLAGAIALSVIGFILGVFVSASFWF